MRRSLLWIPLVVAITECDSQSAVPSETDPEPVAQFGSIAVQVDGKHWFVLPGPNSVVAYFDPQLLQLMVQAPLQGIPGYRQLVSLRICGIPVAQAYSFASPGLGLAATWITPFESRRSRGGIMTQQAVYSSLGSVEDSLVFAETNWSTGQIRGRFHFHAKADPNYFPQGRDTLTVIGFFSGRVLTRYLSPCR